MHTLLGIDYGTARIGLALADTETAIATPHSIIENDDTAVSQISKLVNDRGVRTIIIGESKNHAGEDNELMTQIRSFVKALEEKSGVPTVYIPEFFTSAQARRQPEAERDVDDSAAAIILQTYLERHHA